MIAAAALGLAFTAAALDEVLDGLIAYWPLDEGQGKQWQDAVGAHKGHVEKGGEWTDDAQVGKAFAFVEQTLVRVDDEDDINELPDGFTIAHWMKPERGGAIMDKSANDGARIQWYFSGDGRPHWGLGANFGITDAILLKAGEWAHVAWSHVPGVTLIFVNGEQVFQQELGAVPVTNQPMYFGNRLPDDNRQEWFGGVLDEIGFWNRGLSAEEVSEVEGRGIQALLAVEPSSTALTTTWASLKVRD